MPLPPYSDGAFFRIVIAGNDATTYIPNDVELLDGFKESRLINLQSRGIIYLIESNIRPANSSTILLGFDNYSLEHLMPKKWRNNWGACSSDDLARQRDSKLLTLGNLAIIPQSLNASIRDGNWQTKKEGKGVSRPGLEVCAAGLSTVFDALQKDTWDESCIHITFHFYPPSADSNSIYHCVRKYNNNMLKNRTSLNGC